MAREMKDSGVEWIGEIPREWETRNIKNMFSFGKGLSITKENLKEQGIAVISYGQIHSKLNRFYEISNGLIKFVDESYLETDEQSLVNRGDFIFADTSEDVEGCGNFIYVDEQQTLFAGYHTIILRSLTQKDNRFLAFLFMSDCWRKQIRERVNGVKLFSISQKLIKRTNILIPPEEERVRIVNYLEDQCNTIDNVPKKIRASIEEYKKLKQAIITQVVAKGVRGNREMKDSQSTWFGQIPSDWNMRKIKYIFKIQKDIAGGEGHIVLSITQKGIKPKDLSKNEGQLAENYSNYQLVHIGDFAMNHMDLLTGWVDISKYEGVTSPDYRVFGLIDKDNYYSQYYLYLMQMCYTNRIFYGLGQGVSGLGRWRLQADKFLNFSITVPSYEEQKEIANYLDKKCSAIDELIAKKEQYLSEIENYKKSLIYEYVTGKKEVSLEYQV